MVLATTARTGWGGLAGLAVPTFVFVATTGLIAGNAAPGTLKDFPAKADAGSALFGAFQYGGGILGSALVGMFADGTAWPMGFIVGTGGLGHTAVCLVPTGLPGSTGRPSSRHAARTLSSGCEIYELAGHRVAASPLLFGWR
ncbi:MAG: hypothetical protein ACRYGP_01140 [Janthinobacterium lividum]